MALRTITVAAIWKVPPNRYYRHRIYVVRDGDLVMYVGQSMRNVIGRLRTHLDERRPSLLGELIKVNHPMSKHWQVDLYMLADCAAYVDQFALFPLQEGLPYDSNTAEKGMIWKMRPVINRKHNPHPSLLPDGYRGHSILLAREPESIYMHTEANWFANVILNGWVCAHGHESGRTEWWHHSGATLSDEGMTPYRVARRVPSINHNAEPKEVQNADHQ